MKRGPADITDWNNYCCRMSNRVGGNEFSCINYPLCFFLVTSFYSTLKLIIKLQIVSSREMSRTRSAARTRVSLVERRPLLLEAAQNDVFESEG